MKNLIITVCILLGLSACNNKHNTVLPPSSVYNLKTQWQTQDGNNIQLATLKGKVVVMVMIYTTCKTACPILTAKMKDIATKVGDANPNDIRYVLVSIDPEHDTPEKMKEYLTKNNFSSPEWLFLRSNEDNTRQLANVLAVKYKDISPIEFSHSNIISVFAKDGTLAFQNEGLDLDIEGTVNEVNKQLTK